VGEVEGWKDSEWRWRLSWRRVRFQWEATQEDEMLKLISRVQMHWEVKDVQVWGVDASGISL